MPLSAVAKHLLSGTTFGITLPPLVLLSQHVASSGSFSVLSCIGTEKTEFQRAAEAKRAPQQAEEGDGGGVGEDRGRPSPAVAGRQGKKNYILYTLNRLDETRTRRLEDTARVWRSIHSMGAWDWERQPRGLYGGLVLYLVVVLVCCWMNGIRVLDRTLNVPAPMLNNLVHTHVSSFSPE